jgi:hypothetical protein
MSDNGAEEKSMVHKKNQALREASNVVLREVFRVVEMFRRGLEWKEDRRLGLKEQMDKLLRQIEANFDKLQMVIKNISTYHQSLQKIHDSLKDVREKEAEFQEKYSRLLEGLPPEEEEFKSRMARVTATGTLNRDVLIRRRKDYLDGLDGVFKKLEEELLSLERIRKEMDKAQMDLQIKQEEAMETKEMLERHSRELLDRVKLVELELDTTVGEERILLREFEELLKHVDERVVVRDEVDAILLEMMNALQSRKSVQSGTASDADEASALQ